jgi:hypothetical protein
MQKVQVFLMIDLSLQKTPLVSDPRYVVVINDISIFLPVC